MVSGVVMRIWHRLRRIRAAKQDRMGQGAAPPLIAQRRHEAGVAWSSITTMHEVPRYLSLWSSHPDHVLALGTARDDAVVLDLGERYLAVLIDERLPDPVRAVLVGNLRQRCALQQLTVLWWAVCPTPLIKKLQGNALQDAAQGRASNNDALSCWMNWVAQAVQLGATDVHIRIGEHQASVAVRVHGALEPLTGSATLAAQDAMAAVNAAYLFLSLQGSNSAGQLSTSTPCSAMIRPQTVGQHSVTVRLQSVPGAFGLLLVGRLLHFQATREPMSLAALGYEPSQVRALEQACRRGAGLILLAGTTNSGKTTTLQSLLASCPQRLTGSLITVEDPVEYRMPLAHQISIQRQAGDDPQGDRQFAIIMAALMRADPDVLVMGEIRDRATGRAALEMAKTGHLVMGSVHAMDASGVMARLAGEGIGMPLFDITAPGMVALLCHQTLLPVLCAHCKVSGASLLSRGAPAQLSILPPELSPVSPPVSPTVPPPVSPTKLLRPQSPDDPLDTTLWQVQTLLQQMQARYQVPASRWYFRHATGCDACHGRGVSGMTVVADLITPDAAWLSLMREGRDFDALAHWRAHADGAPWSNRMVGKTLLDHALLKAWRGEVDLRECLALGLGQDWDEVLA